MTKRRTSMEVSIKELLEAHGLLLDFYDAAVNREMFHVRFEKPNFDPLVIELLPGSEWENDGGMKVSVAHYFEMNGDLIQDPEIVFDLATWEPLEITQQFGGYRRKFYLRDGKVLVDMNFRRDVMPLVRVWAKNIRHQGWDAAEVKRS